MTASDLAGPAAAAAAMVRVHQLVRCNAACAVMIVGAVDTMAALTFLGDVNDDIDGEATADAGGAPPAGEDAPFAAPRLTVLFATTAAAAAAVLSSVVWSATAARRGAIARNVAAVAQAAAGAAGAASLLRAVPGTSRGLDAGLTLDVFGT